MNAITVGSQLPPLSVGPISRATLSEFADASGDQNPIHIDIAVARSVGLDDVFAQGMLGMAQLGRLLTDWAPQECIRSFQVRFVAITPLHANPTCTGTVVGLDGDLATVALVVTLDDGTVTLTGEATLAIDHRARIAPLAMLEESA